MVCLESWGSRLILMIGAALLLGSASCGSDSVGGPALASSSVLTSTTPSLPPPEQATAQAWQQGRITIAPPREADVPSITRDEALAATAKTGLVDLNVPGEQPYARYGRYTDKAGPFSVDDAGQPHLFYEDRLVWLITLDNVLVYPMGNGPPRPPDAPPQPSPAALAAQPADIGVVIDAVDGKFLKLWTDPK